MALQPFWTLPAFSVLLILYTVGRTPWTGDQPVARPLPTHRATQIQNKRTQTSIPRVGFEPMIAVFERAKTVHALDRAATVIGNLHRFANWLLKVLECSTTKTIFVQQESIILSQWKHRWKEVDSFNFVFGRSLIRIHVYKFSFVFSLVC
jgi:hypothetical protein